MKASKLFFAFVNQLFIWAIVFAMDYTAPTWDTPLPLPIGSPVYASTSAGILEGFRTEPESGQIANVFKRIPYAEPPLGDLRFRKLRSPKSWTGVWNATYYSPACPSNTTRTTSPQENISEDCIYANIFTDPKCMNGQSKCPVLVYVHGGGFYYDAAVMFNDREIVKKYASDGVVLVIPAFRLGVFAVLDVDDENVVHKNLGFLDVAGDGNCGFRALSWALTGTENNHAQIRRDIMKHLADTVTLHECGVESNNWFYVIFALKWISREVKNFGGDARRITVMGSSGGAGVVSFLLTSPAVPGNLFQQAIINSGIAMLKEKSALPVSQSVLSAFNCSSSSALANVDCLRKVSMWDLLCAQNYFVELRGVTFPFKFLSPSRVLPAESFTQLLTHLKAKKIWFATTLHELKFDENQSSESYCLETMPAFGYNTTAVLSACIDRYYGPEKHTLMNERKSPESEAMHSQSLLTALANLYEGGVSYRSLFTLPNHTHHSDDQLFFIGLHWQNRTYTAAEKLMDAYYPKIVKNFINFGYLDKEWKSVGKDGKGYFDLDFEFDPNSRKLVKWPHFESGYDDPDAEIFWLEEALRLENVALGYKTQNSKITENLNPFSDLPVILSQPYVFAQETKEITGGISADTWISIGVLIIVVTITAVIVTMWRYKYASLLANESNDSEERNETTKILSSSDTNTNYV